MGDRYCCVFCGVFCAVLSVFLIVFGGLLSCFSVMFPVCGLLIAVALLVDGFGCLFLLVRCCCVYMLVCLCVLIVVLLVWICLCVLMMCRLCDFL